MSTKKLIARIFFGTEFLIWLFFYHYGSQGMRALKSLRSCNNELEQTMMQEAGMITALEKECQAWHTDFFYKEKAAREQLQMARRDELVFYVT